MSSLLTLEAISKHYTTEPILRNLSLEIQPGEIISLVGPSGCGKSTLLRLISGLDREHEGQILVDGNIIREPNRTVGLMFQEPRLFPWLEVRDNIAFGLAPERRKHSQKLVNELLEQVGLSESAKLLPRQLSGGMAQRVALARALAGEPGLLLLDEPFSALDAFTRMRLQEVVLAIWLRYQPTMLLVTHDIDEALYLSDRVVILAEKPASVQKIIEVGLERPRDRRHPELLRLRSELLEALRFAGSGLSAMPSQSPN